MIEVDISTTVTELNEYVKRLIENDENLRYVYVRGEISNWKIAMNGHAYFYLKDDKSVISAVLFKDYISKLSFKPKDGDEVKALCSITVYPPRGTYSLRVYEMSIKGEGQILVELEKLKKQLQKEGLFDVSRKREINIYPTAIGIITALNSAAMKDIVTNIKRRYPVADIYVFPSAVQGDNAPKELYEAFMKSQQYPLDTLIIGRGGGASEDLSAFNDEKLVRAIATSKMPVIAAVGHEIDITLVDYVADKRASTPTGAAELATVDQREIQERLSNAISDMELSLRRQVEDYQEEVLSLKEDMTKYIKDSIEDRVNTLKYKKEHFVSLSPKSILKRGYSITVDDKGQIINSITSLSKDQTVKTIVNDGSFDSVIAKIKEN